MNLPEPDRTTLKHAPLELVVFQVRYETTESINLPHVALALSHDLKDRYPKFEPAQQSEVVFELGPNGAQTSGTRQTSGWRLSSGDDKWIIQVMPESAAVECTGYTTWSEFFDRVGQLCHAILSTSAPKLVYRIGLRYVDRIIVDGARRPVEWNAGDLLNPTILPFSADAAVADELAASQTVSHFLLDTCQVILKSSCAPDPRSKSGYSTVLDTDCFDSTVREFSAENVAEIANDLHMVALKFFQRGTTPRLLELLNS